MKKLLFTVGLIGLFSCSKTNTTTEEQKATEDPQYISVNQVTPPVGGGGGQVVQPQPTYLIPTGGSTYTCQYAGITVNFTSVSYSSGPATRAFNDYGTYNTVGAYANATTSSSNASGGGSGDLFNFTESYCAGFDQNTLCTNWQTRNFSGYLVRVLNPPAGSPSFLALVPPSAFTTTPSVPPPM